MLYSVATPGCPESFSLENHIRIVGNDAGFTKGFFYTIITAVERCFCIFKEESYTPGGYN
jgi:hypothetical protein